MTEKVKLPREVAEAIEGFRNADFSDYGIVNAMETVSFGLDKQRVIIRDWIYEENGSNADSLLDALRIGYVVEPDFNVGDWVVHQAQAKPEMIIKLYPDVIETETLHGREKEFRRATLEEIKAEKERRMWTKMGRKVGLFDRGDVGMHVTGSMHYDPFEISKYYVLGELKGFYPAESFILFGGGEE